MFDRHLYKEGLRRLKVIGIGISAALIIISVLIPILNNENSRILGDTPVLHDSYVVHRHVRETEQVEVDGSMIVNEKYVEDPEYEIIIPERKYIDFNELYISAPLLSIALIAPIFAYVMFDFLFKRRSCDIFHAIPAKRRTVFFSFMLAWLTWVLGIIIACESITVLTWITTHCYRIPFSFIAFEILRFTVLAIFCSAFAFLPIMIAGTPWTSAVLGLSMFCLPMVFGPALLQSLACVPGFDCKSDFMQTFDILSYYPVYMLQKDPDATFIFSMIFALIFGILAIFFSGFLYCRRKSENAGTASPSGHAKTFIRAMIASLPTLAVAMYICRFILNGPPLEDLSFIWFILAALLLWFLYELITTKSFKKMLQSVKTLWILPAIASVFILAVLGCRLWMLIDVPSGSQVESVTIFPGVNYESSDRNISGPYLLDGVEITDPNAIKTLIDILDLNVHNRQDDTPVGYRVIFNLKNGRKLDRMIRVDAVQPDDRKERERSICYYIESLPDYFKKTTELDRESIIFSSVEVMYGVYLDEFEQNKILDVFFDEYQELDDYTQYDIMQISGSNRPGVIYDPDNDYTQYDIMQISGSNRPVVNYYPDNIQATITVREQLGSNAVWKHFYISDDKMPKTFAAMRKILDTNQEKSGTRDDFTNGYTYIYPFKVFDSIRESLNEFAGDQNRIESMNLKITLCDDSPKPTEYTFTFTDPGNDKEKAAFVYDFIIGKGIEDAVHYAHTEKIRLEQEITYSEPYGDSGKTRGVRTVTFDFTTSVKLIEKFKSTVGN